MKDCLIIGPKTALGYNDVFPLLVNKTLQVGIYVLHFLENKNIAARWFTTLQVNRPEEKKLKLAKTYNKEYYQVLDNYDAIYCNSKDVPVDYEGKIAVPITFLKYYPYLDYEVIEHRSDLKLNGKTVFERLIIQKKK